MVIMGTHLERDEQPAQFSCRRVATFGLLPVEERRGGEGVDAHLMGEAIMRQLEVIRGHQSHLEAIRGN